jgi:hypothetical protein
MTQLIDARFKYTVPVSKAEADDEGLYLYGEAAGTEVDKQQERMSPEAIKAFAQQIKDRYFEGNPIPYVDEHDKSTSGRGVLRHLGDVVDGGITGNDHLWVKVRLNEKNPAATFLYSQIVDEGKQYGMSIQGSVLEFVDEVAKSIGQKIRTFKSVILDHIANTTKPVWTPSLGTVLNRAVVKALEDESNGEEMAEETVVESTKVTEETTTETPANETVSEATTEETKVEAAAETPAETPSALDELVNKFVSAIDTRFAELAESLKAQTPAPQEVARSEAETPEPAISKSESDEDRLAALEAELATLRERSATPTPPVITKAQTEEFEGLLKSMSPEERLRMALAARHGEEF